MCFKVSGCHLQFHRPEANYAISGQPVDECTQVLAACAPSVGVVVFSGLPEVLYFAVDFLEVTVGCAPAYTAQEGPWPMCDLWLNVAKVRSW
ncbi:enoyl-CoA hydratase-related protein [Tahibacter sp.]|uniref:enoyl-CoA hydratase-related protein n=1 Tax=Tahibacter sp. TaxID=2056211 RepID=UPI0028C3F5E2|nr:enoyl-CoA hydratase-related protein [Tahibacter sp.]